MNLMIDDERAPSYVESRWGIKVDKLVRTAQEGINDLKANKIDVLFLDHDLQSFDSEGNEITGTSIMLFLKENPEYLPNRIIFITMNPIGLQRMSGIYEEILRSQNANS